jgi:hypothetical protein
MTWFKVDDKLHDHRKARNAGCHAMGLWLMAGSWSADNLTDGFVPVDIAERWDRKNFRRLAARLVEVGLWHEATVDGEKGWQFHQWNEDGRQPTAEKVKKERAEAAERQRRAREAAKKKRDAEAARDAVTDLSHRDTSARHADVTGVVTVPPTRPDPTRPVLGGCSDLGESEPDVIVNLNSVPARDASGQTEAQVMSA